MVDDPLFSVVMPTYNRGSLIRKSLDTVFNQTYQNFEIIVVDDCSTDNTEEVLKPLIDSGKIRYIKQSRNLERAHSRNTGMENARGDFVTFLDSDDLMYDTNLEDAAVYVRQNPDVKVFQNEYQLVDENNKLLCNFDFPSLDDHLRAITGGNFMSCIGDFIHRDIYERYRFDTNPVLVASEDWLFWMKVLADHKPGRISKVNNGVVFHSKRSVNSIGLKELETVRLYIIKSISEDPHLRKTYGKHLKRLEASALLYASTVANRTRLHTEALKCLLKAALLDLSLVGSINFVKALGIAVLRIDKGH